MEPKNWFVHNHKLNDGKFKFSSSKAICLPDLIIRSLYNSNDCWISWDNLNVNNNVELWAKRIDNSLTHFGYL